MYLTVCGCVVVIAVVWQNYLLRPKTKENRKLVKAIDQTQKYIKK